MLTLWITKDGLRREHDIHNLKISDLRRSFAPITISDRVVFEVDNCYWLMKDRHLAPFKPRLWEGARDTGNSNELRLLFDGSSLTILLNNGDESDQDRADQISDTLRCSISN